MKFEPYRIQVAGDNYLVSYLCPHGERHDEWERRSYHGGAAALEDYCRGLLIENARPTVPLARKNFSISSGTCQPLAPGKQISSRKDRSADRSAAPNLSTEKDKERLLLHRAHEVEDETNKNVHRWYIDTSPPVGEREYVATNTPFHKCAPSDTFNEKDPQLLLIRDAGSEECRIPEFYQMIPANCHIVRFSSPLVRTAWKAADAPLEIKCQSWTEIIDIDQIARVLPIAKSSSYEAITRDLLRFFAGNDPRRIFKVPAGNSLTGPPVTFVVRLHSGAMLVLACPMPDQASRKKPHPNGETTHFQDCTLIFHPKLPAPLMAGKKNKIGGTGGMLAAQLAVHLASHFHRNPGTKPDTIFELVAEGVSNAIVLGHAASELGLEFLGKDYNKADYPLEDFMRACVVKRRELQEQQPTAPQKEKKDPLIPVRLDFARIERLGDKKSRIIVVADDLLEIKSIHTEWLIQNVRTRQWREAAASRFTGKDICDHCHPAAIVAGVKLVRKEAMKHVHSVDIEKSRLVDRNEVEDYLALQSVLKSYATTLDAPRPLNLGVFGAPGSGKSFGVKQLVEYCGKSGLDFAEKILEFNMSQFSSTSDLADSLHQVRDMCMSGKIPVAFFDEFDASFNGANFGWLKYLLMPMQDSVFWDQNKQYRLGRCVLIFAGGINRSFHELNGRVRDQEFVIAKGPDFVSRLRGYLNIRSINFPENATPVEKQRCQLRRAVLLENMLERKHGGKSIEAPLLDLPLAHAMLNIEGFRHGVRSLEAILDMSEFVKKETLLASSLPTWAQMEMHVDSRQWAKLLMEGEKEFEWLTQKSTSPVRLPVAV